MPQSNLNHPPPSKPAVTQEVETLRIIVEAMNVELPVYTQGRPSRIPVEIKALYAVRNPIIFAASLI
jgi:hypothetical protein